MTAELRACNLTPEEAGKLCEPDPESRWRSDQTFNLTWQQQHGPVGAHVLNDTVLAAFRTC